MLLAKLLSPDDLERQIEAFVAYYNNQRCLESLHNITPADVYFGCDKAILRGREKIKALTIRQLRLQAMKEWRNLNPEFFKKQPYYPLGCKNYPNG